MKPAISFKRNRKGALEMSFGMIFSIILIIAFLAAGFYAIKKFIDFQNTIQIEQFSKSLQDDVDKMWKSQSGSQNLKYSLPTFISSVCFFSGEELVNMRFTAKNIIPEKQIENIDILRITESENPYCIDNVKGKVSLTIAKDFGETLARIMRQSDT